MTDLMFRKVIVSLLALTLIGFPSFSQRRLTVLHVNDTHSRLEPERSGEYAGKGGVIERAAYRDSVVKADGRRNVLFMEAGDFNVGTEYYPAFGGDLEIDIINSLKYDCVTLGNHEFDNGIDDLARRLRRLKCAVVCCNYDFSGTPLNGIVKPYAVFRRACMKIGVIGIGADLTNLISNELAASMPGLPVAETAMKWASFLKEEKGCDIVIALSHRGFDRGSCPDTEIAASTRNIDIIVGGHTHTRIREPLVCRNLDGRPVAVVQDHYWGLSVGNLKINKPKENQ